MPRIVILYIATLMSCAIEDPSISDMNFLKIKFAGEKPLEATLNKTDEQGITKGNLTYEMVNGDTLQVQLLEFENTQSAEDFFANNNEIIKKAELLIDYKRRRYFHSGRRVFIFSYNYSISENAPLRDSIDFFVKKFPTAN